MVPSDRKAVVGRVAESSASLRPFEPQPQPIEAGYHDGGRPCALRDLLHSSRTWRRSYHRRADHSLDQKHDGKRFCHAYRYFLWFYNHRAKESVQQGKLPVEKNVPFCE